MSSVTTKNTKSKKAYIFFHPENIEVTIAYLDVIKNSLETVGYECEYTTSLTEIPQKSLIIFATGVDAYKYYCKGYHYFAMWQQGVTAEESYMRNKSLLRMKVLNYMDCFAMKKAKMIFFVSDYMKEHYKRLARKDFDSKSYVMPCYNEKLEFSVFDKKDYSKKTFAYVGSMAVWQCFEQTAALFAKIEQAIPETFFKVLTFETAEATVILNKYGIKNYEVKCVPKAEVKQELEGISYGFILREDIEVNRVATPTKISSYLSAGIIPIYSSCLSDFHQQARGKSFAFPFDIGQNAEELIMHLKRDIDSTVVMNEIEEIFETYYNTETHILGIVDKMKKVKL